jgi:hypothetical protein
LPVIAEAGSFGALSIIERMKKFVLLLLVTLAMVCFARQSHAQGTLAPLYLFTSGAGSITPFQNGDLLQVGQSNNMTAIPDSGYTFSSWQLVNVFIIAQTNFDSGGNPILPPITSIDASPVPQFTYQPELGFIMQPLMMIITNGSNPNIAEIVGWQANFVAVPEPSDATLVVFGFTLIALFRRRPKERRPCSLLL